MIDDAQDTEADVGIDGVYGHLHQRHEEQLSRGGSAQHSSHRDEHRRARKVTVQQTEGERQM